MQCWSHFKLNMMQEIFHFLNFQEFIKELGELCFPLGKMEFWTHLKFCTYKRIFDLGKGPANTLTLYLQTLTMQISTQIDNHKYRKSVAISIVLKNGSEVSKPYIQYFICKIAFIFFTWNANPLEFRVKWGHSGTRKRGRIGLWLYASIS